MPYKSKTPVRGFSRPEDIQMLPGESSIAQPEFSDLGTAEQELGDLEAYKLDDLQARQKSGKLMNFLKGINSGKSADIVETFGTIPQAWQNQETKVKDFFKREREGLFQKRQEQELLRPDSQQSRLAQVAARARLRQMRELASKHGDAQMLADLEQMEAGLSNMSSRQISSMFGEGGATAGKQHTSKSLGGGFIGDVLKDAGDAELDELKKQDILSRIASRSSSDEPKKWDEDSKYETNFLASRAKEFRADERYKSLRSRLSGVGEVATFLTNPATNLASKLVGAALARISGDKGALSNYDVTRYTTQEGVIGKITQALRKLSAGGQRGSMTMSERAELWYMTQVLKDIGLREFSAIKNDFANSIYAMSEGKIPMEKIMGTLGGELMLNDLATISGIKYSGPGGKHSSKDAQRMLRGTTGGDPRFEEMMKKALARSIEQESGRPRFDLFYNNLSSMAGGNLDKKDVDGAPTAKKRGGIIPYAELEKYSKTHKMSIEEAEAKLTGKGYVIKR